MRRSRSLIGGLFEWMTPRRGAPDVEDGESEAPREEAADAVPERPSQDFSRLDALLREADAASREWQRDEAGPVATPIAARAAHLGDVSLSSAADVSHDAAHPRPSPFARRHTPARPQTFEFHSNAFESPKHRAGASPFATPGRRHTPIYFGGGTSVRRTPLRSSLAASQSMSAISMHTPALAREEATAAATPESLKRRRVHDAPAPSVPVQFVQPVAPPLPSLPPSASAPRLDASSSLKRPAEDKEPQAETPVRRHAPSTRAASAMLAVLETAEPLPPPAPAVPEVVNPYQTRSKTPAAPATQSPRSTRAKALDAARKRATTATPHTEQEKPFSLLDVVERTEPMSLRHSRRGDHMDEEPRTLVPPLAHKPKRPSPLAASEGMELDADVPTATPLFSSSQAAAVADAPATPRKADVPAVTKPHVDEEPKTEAPSPAAPQSAPAPDWCVLTPPTQRSAPVGLTDEQRRAMDVPYDALPVFAFHVAAAGPTQAKLASDTAPSEPAPAPALGSNDTRSRVPAPVPRGSQFSAEKPACTFDASQPRGVPKPSVSAEKPSASFSFGTDKPSSSLFGAASDKPSTSFSFGGAPDKPSTSFSFIPSQPQEPGTGLFGASGTSGSGDKATPASSSDPPRPAFSFGSSESKPAFSFGSFKPSFSFGSKPATGGSTTPGFSFGGTTSGFSFTAPKPAEPLQGESQAEAEPTAASTDNTLTACGEGEENETTLHEVRSKIWRLDAGQWQDLGISLLRIKKDKDSGKCRILARNAVNGSVVLNFALYTGIKVTCEKNVIMFLGFVDTKPCNLRCKVKTSEAAEELKNAITSHAQ